MLTVIVLERRIFIVKLGFIMLNVVRLNVVRLNVVIMNVLASLLTSYVDLDEPGNMDKITKL
jgi:hypothetical protein